jgi:restriction endonuclease S subunit
MSERRYLPTLSELIDRLSINQIKEVQIPEHKKEYAQEIQDILHDIDAILKENNVVLNAEVIRAIIVVAQFNREIWLNESAARKGNKDGNNLYLSHGLNSIRNNAKNRIQSVIGGRKDYKLDNVEAFPEWIPSGYEK